MSWAGSPCGSFWPRSTPADLAARRRVGWLAAVLLWLYPWWYLSTAGWVATTMHYLWPLAGLCLALVSLTGWGGRAGAAVGLLGLVYGVNAEQTAVLALFLLAAFAAWRLAARQPLPVLPADQPGGPWRRS